MLKQNLQQKLGLKIHPLQIQLIKLIELPTYQLEQRVKEELETNPLLEEGDEVDEDEALNKESSEVEDRDDSSEEEVDDFADDTNSTEDRSEEDDFSIDDYMDDDDIPEYRTANSNISPDDEDRELVITQGASFRESLVNQLGMRHLTEQEEQIAEYIIGNIDDDGYLRRDLENIVDDLAFNAGISVTIQELKKLLLIVQSFEPFGVGARDLRECLLIQLNHKLEATPDDKALLDAKAILTDCFDEFTRKHYEKITHNLHISDGELKTAMEQILKLNPKPGGGVGDSGFVQDAGKIIPDFILDMVDGELQLNLNASNVPELRINRSYLNVLEGYQKGSHPRNRKDVTQFIKYKLSSAKAFIDAVQQRNNTLMLTMTAIIQYQRRFFLSGGDRNMLRPMILKDIAEVTGLDVSTISRVSNSKYVQTWFGIYPLKDFFDGSMSTTDGDEVSSGELKNALRDLIAAEDKHTPLTDDELVTMMEKKGYKIARRTVAKYRQMLDIPVARLRREI